MRRNEVKLWFHKQLKIMNKHGGVEVAGLVFVGNKLLHDTGVTVWAVFYHNHQFLLDYTFIFLFSVSLILSGYISS